MKGNPDASLAEELPFWDFLPDPFAHAVLADGSLIAGLRLSLIDVECFDDIELNRLTMGLRAALNAVSEGIILHRP